MALFDDDGGIIEGVNSPSLFPPIPRRKPDPPGAPPIPARRPEVTVNEAVGPGVPITPILAMLALAVIGALILGTTGD